MVIEGETAKRERAAGPGEGAALGGAGKRPKGEDSALKVLRHDLLSPPSRKLLQEQVRRICMTLISSGPLAHPGEKGRVSSKCGGSRTHRVCCLVLLKLKRPNAARGSSPSRRSTRTA
jgi:hypothetical protein